MFPHVHLPLGFKTPKFEKYDGHGDPIAHLKRYCNQLRGADGKEELLMAYFGESLVGIASEWYMDQDMSRWYIWDDLARDFVRQFQYNVDIAPDRNSLTNLKKKPSENFREYAVKWREQASRVKPPMDEIEMVTVFLQAQEPDYFQNMMSAMGKPFAEAIKIGDMVEHGLKTGRILSQASIRATSQAIQGGSGGMAKNRTREETTMAASWGRRYRAPRPVFSEITPQHYYPHSDMVYAPPLYAVMNAQPFSRPQPQANRNQPPFQRNQPPHQNHYNPRPSQNNFRPREPPRRPNYTPIGEPYSTLFPKLVQMNLLQPIPPNGQNPESPSYQQVSDEDVPNVTNNSLPAHNNGPMIGMICEDKEFDSALKAIIAIANAERKRKATPKQEKGEKKSKITEIEPEKKIDVSKQAYVYGG
ncbi:uncharacterized protein [Nicotiana sylvestris]|uniref:uncharacterized protein n=1 Tax=Nicotiana sylvestris TaxID=4096 RepID=UPI00388C7EE2